MNIESKIISLNIANKKGELKRPVAIATLAIDQGVIGDAHVGPGMRQVSILGQESIDAFNERTKKQIKPGDFAENLTINGIDLTKVSVLDRLQINDVVLEITQLGKKCHGAVCAIFREVGQCAMPKEGVFARVVQGGAIKPGDTIKYVPYRFKVLVITLSDRAAAKIYEDKSGPKAQEYLAKFFEHKRWHVEINYLLQNDDAAMLRKVLQQALRDNVSAIFTLGGTGVGPRDISPDVVRPFCDKLIPGIMDCIRLKYGAEHPAALLSRSIAGIAKQTLIYTLPGSVRAVEEYMVEIFKTFEHLFYMMHGLDVH